MSKVTVLLPTYNRPQELIRSLELLRLLRNEHKILILDGSHESNKKINSDIIQKFPFARHVTYPTEMHLGVRFNEGLKLVDTPYCMMFSDDDFLIPSALSEIVSFLENNSDYASATGKTLCLGYSRRFPSAFYFIDGLSKIYDLNQKSFINRSLYHDSLAEVGCSPLYYVMRKTELARQIYAKMNSGITYATMERICHTFTLLAGKSRALPSLSILRNYSSVNYRMKERMDPTYLMSESDIIYSREQLRPDLIKTENLPPETAQYVIDQVLTLPPVKQKDHINWAQWNEIGSIKFQKLYRFQQLGFLLFPSLMAKAFGLDKNVIKSLRKAMKVGV